MSVFNRLLSRRPKALGEAAEKSTSASTAGTDTPQGFQDSQRYPDLVPEGVELIDPVEIEAFFLALEQPAMPMELDTSAARSPPRPETGSSTDPASIAK